MSGLAASYGAGGSLFLATMLLLGGMTKVASVRSFALTLQGLFAPGIWHAPGLTPTTLARLVIAVELGLGVALAVAGRTVALAACGMTVLLFSGFLWAVLVAMRKGINCGCFGRLAKSPAGPAELTRTVALVAVAVSVVAARGGDSLPGFRAPAGAFAIAGLLAAIVFGLTELAGSRSRRGEPREPLPVRVATWAGLIQALAPRPRHTPVAIPGETAEPGSVETPTRALVIDPASPLTTEALVAAARADGDYDRLLRSAESGAHDLSWESALAGQVAAGGRDGAAFVLVAVPAGSDSWLTWSPDLLSTPTSLGLLPDSVITVKERAVLEARPVGKVAAAPALEELPVLDRLRELAETTVRFACTAGMAPAPALCRACG